MVSMCLIKMYMPIRLFRHSVQKVIEVLPCAKSYACLWKYMDKCPQASHLTKGLHMDECTSFYKEETSERIALKHLEIQRYIKYPFFQKMSL